MHHHGYLWVGPKQLFDEEALRRPPHPQPPSSGSRPELVRRYRDVVVAFPVSDLPPIETAHWLMKPRTSVRGTWQEPQAAAGWLRERLTEYAPRFTPGLPADGTCLTTLVDSAAQRVGWGGDVSLGYYLERPMFLSLALVTCSPNRAAADLACPVT
ncbi:hypothetical protein RKE29_06420 [Streptomyces sp. B1866]|uniref:hypothetical protein n=1 Tax=Streptomyces sp. B1866 TaxID=3075431 RepID=UPI00289059A6|nr:hypothetical protein [Streptomyces sp. B1866]MDT3396275.1 hypothetical protein [Streptomyces sp. B1866]